MADIDDRGQGFAAATCNLLLMLLEGIGMCQVGDSNVMGTSTAGRWILSSTPGLQFKVSPDAAPPVFSGFGCSYHATSSSGLFLTSGCTPSMSSCPPSLCPSNSVSQHGRAFKWQKRTCFCILVFSILARCPSHCNHLSIYTSSIVSRMPNHSCTCDEVMC